MEIQVEITNECSFNCLHCSNAYDENSTIKTISYNFLKKFITIIPYNSTIFFTGGEPQNVNLIELMNIFNNDRKDINFGVFTTGLNLRENIITHIDLEKSILQKQSGLSTAYFSIYHSERACHDFITGVNESFDGTINAINNYLKAGIECRIHLILNKLNIKHLKDIINNLQKYKISEIRLLKLVKTGNSIKNWDDIGVELEAQNNALKSISLEINQFEIPISISGFPELIPCRRGSDAVGCQAGSKLLYITLAGDVFPCACVRNSSNFKLGNIDDIAFFKNYFSKLKNEYKMKCLNFV